MRRFTKLFCDLGQTTRTTEKLALLEEYFREVPPADAAWALQFLLGRIPKRLVAIRDLREWTAAETGLPQWLIDESHQAVGDFAETLALLFPETDSSLQMPLARLVEERLLPLGHLPLLSRRERLVQTWRELSAAERLVWNKLITGNFRIGVARNLVVRALAGVAGVSAPTMAHRLLAEWQPSAASYVMLLDARENKTDLAATPYPFFLALPLELKLKGAQAIEEVLGPIHDWLTEWKWDGIRAQLIRRQGEISIWSRGEELITATFPEVVEIARSLPDGTVLDGEIVVWKGGRPQPFAHLQRRLGRKNVSERLQQSFRVAFVAYDFLEKNGHDIRHEPLRIRRVWLEELVLGVHRLISVVPTATPVQQSLDLFESHEPAHSTRDLGFQISPALAARDWAELKQLKNTARSESVEGLMLKRLTSPYGTGRQRGDWWKWKVDPYVIDAVLIYAQPGQGKRASLFTDYTFGLWHGDELVPVAKAYSGLTDQEIREVDAFVRRRTVERFGPVRMVEPELVFELAFEGVQASDRHKSGVALRFPRMNRWRKDKKPPEADSIEALKSMIGMAGGQV
jgi:DNA ligase 1